MFIEFKRNIDLFCSNSSNSSTSDRDIIITVPGYMYRRIDTSVMIGFRNIGLSIQSTVSSHYRFNTAKRWMWQDKALIGIISEQRHI